MDIDQEMEKVIAMRSKVIESLIEQAEEEIEAKELLIEALHHQSMDLIAVERRQARQPLRFPRSDRVK